MPLFIKSKELTGLDTELAETLLRTQANEVNLSTVHDNDDNLT